MLVMSDLAQRQPGPLTGGEGAFTCYVRALGSDGEPEPEAFHTLWEALRRSVVAELRRCSAWHSPPSYFGVFGEQSWQSWDSGAETTASALDELLNDCYAFVFHQGLPRLRARLAVTGAIDGLVVLSLRHYLMKRRQQHDLLGYHLFKILRQAVREEVERGSLRVLVGDARITSSTLLDTVGRRDASPEPLGLEALQPLVEQWVSDLMPDLMTAAGPRRREVVQHLRGHLFEVEGTFRFKDIADLFKRDARSRWAAIFDLEEGERIPADRTEDGEGVACFAKIARPTWSEDFESRESFERLVSTVAHGIAGARNPEKTYLSSLWSFLRNWAIGEGPAEGLPSHRRLGELLSIPRKRFPGLWAELEILVRAYQEDQGVARGVMSP